MQVGTDASFIRQNLLCHFDRREKSYFNYVVLTTALKKISPFGQNDSILKLPVFPAFV